VRGGYHRGQVLVDNDDAFDRMPADGITTVEAKSGYGLTPEQERRGRRTGLGASGRGRRRHRTRQRRMCSPAWPARLSTGGRSTRQMPWTKRKPVTGVGAPSTRFSQVWGT
jgi:hypothetical protein